MSAKKEVRKDISLFTSREVVLNSEGGKELVGVLKSDLLGDINGLIKEYKSATHIELLARIASMAKSLSLYRLLTNAPIEKAMALKELDRLLEADPEPVEETGTS